MLNDKALCKLMRRTFKAGGVKVYRSQSVLYLDGGWWGAGFLWEAVPARVLAVLAEWLHQLPGQGDGWHCVDGMGDTGYEQLTTPGDNIQALTDGNNTTAGLLKFTPVTCGPSRLAALNSGFLYWFDAEAASILGSLITTGGGELMALSDGRRWGRWIDAENFTTVWLPASDRGVYPGLTETLARFDFWKGEKR